MSREARPLFGSFVVINPSRPGVPLLTRGPLFLHQSRVWILMSHLGVQDTFLLQFIVSLLEAKLSLCSVPLRKPTPESYITLVRKGSTMKWLKRRKKMRFFSVSGPQREEFSRWEGWWPQRPVNCEKNSATGDTTTTLQYQLWCITFLRLFPIETNRNWRWENLQKGYYTYKSLSRTRIKPTTNSCGTTLQIP